MSEKQDADSRVALKTTLTLSLHLSLSGRSRTERLLSENIHPPTLALCHTHPHHHQESGGSLRGKRKKFARLRALVSAACQVVAASSLGGLSSELAAPLVAVLVAVVVLLVPAPPMAQSSSRRSQSISVDNIIPPLPQRKQRRATCQRWQVGGASVVNRRKGQSARCSSRQRHYAAATVLDRSSLVAAQTSASFPLDDIVVGVVVSACHK